MLDTLRVKRKEKVCYFSNPLWSPNIITAVNSSWKRRTEWASLFYYYYFWHGEPHTCLRGADRRSLPRWQHCYNLLYNKHIFQAFQPGPTSLWAGSRAKQCITSHRLTSTATSHVVRTGASQYRLIYCLLGFSGFPQNTNLNMTTKPKGNTAAVTYRTPPVGWQMNVWSWKLWRGRECLRVQFCTVCVLTAGRAEKINLAETCSTRGGEEKRAVNNRNSIKLPWFPVSCALWTAWSDRVWLAERLAGCWSAPTAAQRTLSWPRFTALICTSSEWGLLLYSAGWIKCAERWAELPKKVRGPGLRLA